MGKSLVSCFLRHSVYNGPVSVMSLRPSIQSTDSGNGGFAAQFPAGRRYRSTAAGVAPALGSKRGSVMLRADGGGLFYLYPLSLSVGSGSYLT